MNKNLEKDVDKKWRQELLSELEKEIIGRLPAFPPQEKAGKMADIKLFSANDILDIIKKIKQ